VLSDKCLNRAIVTRAHAPRQGAVDRYAKWCEACGVKRPKYGMMNDSKRRWCQGCAEQQIGAIGGTVRARPGRLSGLSVSHSRSVLYGAFVRVRRALNGPSRRSPPGEAWKRQYLHAGRKGARTSAAAARYRADYRRALALASR
jgi:hypothetical protein